ncbi:hypothetical protein MASR2M29_11990 [Spirochaetota bacterium]
MSDYHYESLFDKALEAGAKRNYKEAEEQLTKIVAETDSIPQALLYLGRTRHALGEYERAISAFSLYLEQFPESGEAWFFMGRTYLALGLLREAVHCLRLAIERGSDRPDTWAILGLAELRQKRSSKAVDSLLKAVNLAPQNKRIYKAYLNALSVHAIRSLAKGDYREAAAMLAFVIDNGLDGLTQHLYRASALKAMGQNMEALDEIKVVLSIENNDPSLHLQAAALYLAIGDSANAMKEISLSGINKFEQNTTSWSKEAIERYRIILALKEGKPKLALKAALERIRAGEADAAIRAVAAQANFELGRYQKASEHYRRAVEADPSSPELKLGLALALWECADYAQAGSMARAAIARGAKKEDALYIEVLCDVKLEKNPELLLPRVQDLLIKRPGDPRLIMAYAECLYRTGRPDLADAWFEKVLVIIPGHEMSLLYRISAAESVGNKLSALERYEDYILLYPDNTAIRKDYISALIDNKEWNSAVKTIEDGVAYGLKAYEAILAMAYRNSGRYREAAGLYRNLLKADPKNSELLLALTYSLNKSGSKSLAAELLERGAAYIAKDAEPYLALGVLRAREGDPEKAAAAFLKASELAPADPRPLRNLAKLYANAGISQMALRFEQQADSLEAKKRIIKK